MLCGQYRRLGFARNLVDEVLGHAFVALACFRLWSPSL